MRDGGVNYGGDVGQVGVGRVVVGNNDVHSAGLGAAQRLARTNPAVHRYDQTRAVGDDPSYRFDVDAVSLLQAVRDVEVRRCT